MLWKTERIHFYELIWVLGSVCTQQSRVLDFWEYNSRGISEQSC